MMKTVILTALTSFLLAAVLFGFILWAQNTHSRSTGVVSFSGGKGAAPATDKVGAESSVENEVEPQVHEVSSSVNPAATPSFLEEESQREEPERPLPPVTLINDRISIQTATQEVCRQAGLNYQWRRSYDATQPDCRRYVRVDLTRAKLQNALDSIVKSNGLAYCIEGKNVWLERPE